MDQPSFDSSVGRAVDCSGVVIHRSLVRIRLEGYFPHFLHLLLTNLPSSFSSYRRLTLLQMHIQTMLSLVTSSQPHTHNPHRPSLLFPPLSSILTTNLTYHHYLIHNIHHLKHQLPQSPSQYLHIHLDYRWYLLISMEGEH